MKVTHVALLLTPLLIATSFGDVALAKKQSHHSSQASGQASDANAMATDSMDARTQCIQQAQSQYPMGSGPGLVMSREGSYVGCLKSKGVKGPY